MYVTAPNLIKIGQTVAEIWRFNGFLMVVVRHLGFVGCLLGPPGRPLDGLHRYAKFGRNRCRSFDNMKLSIFFLVWLENAYSRPQNWGFRGISPPK